MEFRQKGNKEQFIFNTDVADRIEATAKKVNKIKPASNKEVKILQVALNELQEGMGTLIERQKHICIADQTKNSWKAVEAYNQVGMGEARRAINR